jgi:hypothetical protein
MTDLRYPIGKFDWKIEVAPAEVREAIKIIELAPEALRKAVGGLTPQQLDTNYRPGGWTVRQVVHHVPDSHLNAYTRCKLALTEEKPTIRPYYEDRWAELQDGRNAEIEISLELLENLHSRWVMFLRSLSDSDFNRIFIHPEVGELKLGTNIKHYSWHGRHHTAHITSLRERMGW